jgi:hypothetical protein
MAQTRAKSTPVTKLVFQDPPPRTRPGRKSQWTPILDQLRDRPGEYALIDDDAKRPALVTQINKGKIAGAEEGEFEATSHVNEDGSFSIYARFVG